MATATPVKAVRSCLTCDCSSHGHLKNLRNVAMRSIVFKQHADILNINNDELISMENDKMLICDTCLKTLDKISEMRSTLKKNMIQHQKCQERYKRLILHSVSPVVKKFKDKVLPVKSRKSSKALFNFLSPDKSADSRSSVQNVISQEASDIDETSDHTYIYTELPAKKKPHSEHSYVSTANTAEQEKNDSVGIYQHHKTKMLMPTEISKDDEEIVLCVIRQTADGTIDDMLKKLLTIPSVFERLWQLILLNVSMDIDQICGTKTQVFLGENLQH